MTTKLAVSPNIIITLKYLMRPFFCVQELDQIFKQKPKIKKKKKKECKFIWETHNSILVYLTKDSLSTNPI